MQECAAEAALGRIETATDLGVLADKGGVEYVVEAVPEKEELKVSATSLGVGLEAGDG